MKEVNNDITVYGFDKNNQSLDFSLSKQIIDYKLDLGSLLDFDYLFLAIPVESIKSQLASILDKISEKTLVIDFGSHSPKMVTSRIPNEFIGPFIGPGGKVIQELQKETGCTIVINEDPVTEEGVIEILGTGQEGIETVLTKIDSVTFKPIIGNTYKVKVIKMLDFGAVVEYMDAPGNEVLLHVSELAWERTEDVSDVLKIGDVLEVKYFGVDPRTRKEKVSRKALFCIQIKKMTLI